MRARRMSAVSRGRGIPSNLTAIVAVAAVLLCGTVTSSASAAVSDAELAGHLINTVNPRGTTINLFDYWRTQPGADDTVMPGGEGYEHDNGNRDPWQWDTPNAWWNQGINSGRTLKFGNDMKSQLPAGYCNPEATEGSTRCGDGDTKWLEANLGGSYPRDGKLSNEGNVDSPNALGIVSGVLGADGYPTLSGDSVMVGGDASSLDYLFNPAVSSNYKNSYPDVKNLLKIDEDGYYEFNAKENYAEFDSATKSFNVYDAPAITNESHREERLGQFFPFDSANDAFTDEQGGNLVYDENDDQRALYSNNGNLNHFFGLTMETQFIQQYRGHTEDPTENPNAQEVTYNFSGDDDVWVFIDGVLVGDLGGVHSAVALEINFATGAVTRYIDNATGNGTYNNTYDGENSSDQLIDSTTIAGKMRESAAGNLKKLEEVNSVLDDDDRTLRDDTSHTLQFFYLERGNTDSNMSLKFNFQQIPQSGILKVDQNGQPMRGVEFDLYRTDATYAVGNDATPFYHGVTDEEGGLSFRTDSSEHAVPITLKELAEKSTHWVLRETSTPPGYRKAGDMHLYFQNGLLLSANEWESGAYAQAHVTLSAGTTARKYQYGNPTGVGEVVNLSSGTTFAVVLKRDDNAWYPVSGNATDGWQVSDVDVSNDSNNNAKQAVLDAAASYGAAHIFEVGTNGSYEVTFEELPGDVNTYYYQLLQTDSDNATARAEYTIGYYHTDAESLNSPGAARSVVRLQANDNTAADYDGFDRVFSVTLNVPNIRNTLSLHKTNKEGTPLQGAQFALYQDDNGDGVPDKENAEYSATTGNDGNVSIYTSSGSQILKAGSYVLREEAAPGGYEKDDTAIRIVVDDTGVYVDAGSADDNIAVQLEPGALVSSMKGFAANDQVDATLHDVQAQPQTGTYNAGTWTWTNTKDNPLHFHYEQAQGADGSTLTYVPTGDGHDSYTTQSGWSRLNITQCLNHGNEPATVPDNKENLGGQSLNALFTGNVTILVTNHPEQTEASFNIKKQLNGREWKEADSFQFTVAPDGETPVSGGETTTADAVTSGDVILPAGQSVTIDHDTDLDTADNGIDHTARYGDIVFRKTGTYIFTVSENSEKKIDGINYSDAEFMVTVAVTDLAQDPTVTISAVNLDTADGSIDNSTGTVTFINTYVAPVSALPLTGGDATARNLILAGGGILLLAGVAWLLARRRRV